MPRLQWLEAINPWPRMLMEANVSQDWIKSRAEFTGHLTHLRESVKKGALNLEETLQGYDTMVDVLSMVMEVTIREVSNGVSDKM